ncbi:unnamed protein product [Urochloa humidicola]
MPLLFEEEMPRVNSAMLTPASFSIVVLLVSLRPNDWSACLRCASCHAEQFSRKKNAGHSSPTQSDKFNSQNHSLCCSFLCGLLGSMDDDKGAKKPLLLSLSAMKKMLLPPSFLNI